MLHFLYNKGYIERVSERIISEIVYSILFAIYAIILIIWYTLYDEISFNTNEEINERKCIWNFFKYAIKLRIIIVFIL
jgi:hypothetical protein